LCDCLGDDDSWFGPLGHAVGVAENYLHGVFLGGYDCLEAILGDVLAVFALDLDGDGKWFDVAKELLLEGDNELDERLNVRVFLGYDLTF
jgi:hypothetical protein